MVEGFGIPEKPCHVDQQFPEQDVDFAGVSLEELGIDLHALNVVMRHAPFYPADNRAFFVLSEIVARGRA